MWNFQIIVFVWTQTYSEIFKSALVYKHLILNKYRIITKYLIFIFNFIESKASSRSSHWRCFVKNLFQNLEILREKHLCWSLFLTKLEAFRTVTLLKRDSNTCIFSEYHEIFENTYFEEHLWKVAFHFLWKKVFHMRSFLFLLCACLTVLDISSDLQQLLFTGLTLLPFCFLLPWCIWSSNLIKVRCNK